MFSMINWNHRNISYKENNQMNSNRHKKKGINIQKKHLYKPTCQMILLKKDYNNKENNLIL